MSDQILLFDSCYNDPCAPSHSRKNDSIMDPDHSSMRQQDLYQLIHNKRRKNPNSASEGNSSRWTSSCLHSLTSSSSEQVSNDKRGPNDTDKFHVLSPLSSTSISSLSTLSLNGHLPLHMNHNKSPITTETDSEDDPLHSMHFCNKMKSTSFLADVPDILALLRLYPSIRKMNLKDLINQSTFQKLTTPVQKTLMDLLPQCDSGYCSYNTPLPAYYSENERQQAYFERQFSRRVDAILHPTALTNEFFHKALDDFKERMDLGDLRSSSRYSRRISKRSLKRLPTMKSKLILSSSWHAFNFTPFSAVGKFHRTFPSTRQKKAPREVNLPTSQDFPSFEGKKSPQKVKLENHINIASSKPKFVSVAVSSSSTIPIPILGHETKTLAIMRERMRQKLLQKKIIGNATPSQSKHSKDTPQTIQAIDADFQHSISTSLSSSPVVPACEILIRPHVALEGPDCSQSKSIV